MDFVAWWPIAWFWYSCISLFFCAQLIQNQQWAQMPFSIRIKASRLQSIQTWTSWHTLRNENSPCPYPRRWPRPRLHPGITTSRRPAFPVLLLLDCRRWPVRLRTRRPSPRRHSLSTTRSRKSRLSVNQMWSGLACNQLVEQRPPCSAIRCNAHWNCNRSTCHGDPGSLPLPLVPPFRECQWLESGGRIPSPWKWMSWIRWLPVRRFCVYFVCEVTWLVQALPMRLVFYEYCLCIEFIQVSEKRALLS